MIVTLCLLLVTSAGGIDGRSEGDDDAADLIELARTRIEQDRLEEADDLLVVALRDIEADSTGDENLLADICVYRARIATSLGNSNDARPLFEKSLSIKTRYWGVDHPECVPAITGIATLELIAGDFIEAEQLFERGLSILIPRLDPLHEWIVEAAIGLAESQGYRNDYAAAELTLRPSLDALTMRGGNTDGRSVRLMLALAEALSMQGKDVESTLLFRKAYLIAEEVYGLNHTTTARALAGLAHTYRRSGTVMETRALYRQCVQIVESRHGALHPDLVHYRSRLGMSLFEGDRWSTEAVASIERAIFDAEELYGPESYQAALEERQLGLVMMGRYEWPEAADVFASCIPNLERYFGANHPFLSKSLKGMAWSLLHLNQPDDALYYVDRAVSLHEKSPTFDAFELSFILGMKATIEIDAHSYDAALRSSRRAVELAINVQENNLKISSTREAVLYATRPWATAQALVAAAVAHPSLTDADWGTVFALVAKSHGSVLDWQAERHRFIQSIGGTAGPNAAAKTAAQDLSDLTLNGPGPDTTTYYGQLAAARRRVEEAERELSAATEEWRAASEYADIYHRISRESLSDALPPGTTLVHFLTFTKIVDSPSNTPSWREPHYAAFRLSKYDENVEELDFVDLGKAVSIDSLIGVYRQAVDEIRSPQRPSAREEAEYRQSARTLHDRIWSPLFPDSASDPNRAETDAAPLVLIIPDAGLHRVDFNTLLSPSSELVIEKYKTHLLSSSADLLRSPPNNGIGRNMLAAGNPAPTVNGSLNLTENSHDTHPNRVNCVDESVFSVVLPGAELETKNVALIFEKESGESTYVLTGTGATETRIKQNIESKRIVHLAAHGFVCGGNDNRPRFIATDPLDPLLMSGLVFSPVDGVDDGLLTSREVACLDLCGVELVVLSACGSGLGEIVWGEGMFGLRRAFEIAGARTVMMALWRLDDTGARLLMEEFYKRKLAGASTLDAIHEAQIERLADVRRRLNRFHPALWGGIVTEGDWR